MRKGSETDIILLAAAYDGFRRSRGLESRLAPDKMISHTTHERRDQPPTRTQR